MASSNFTRPVRGAVRLDDLHVDVRPVLKELEAIAESDWKQLGYGSNWSDVALMVKGAGGQMKQHPLMAKAPALRALIESFPATVVDVCLAALAPEGAVKEHRDISGATAAGVIRLHVPLRTAPQVMFYIDRKRVAMKEGEVWHLDTTYRHRVENRSDVNRLHLILDLDASSELKAMLPPTDWQDRLHSAHFALVCVGKAASLVVSNPRQFVIRVVNFFRLKVLRQSVLFKD